MQYRLLMNTITTVLIIFKTIQTGRSVWLVPDRKQPFFHNLISISFQDMLHECTDQGSPFSEIRRLAEELKPVENLRYLNLAENRGITNDGMAAVGALRQLRYLNIGACDINNQGMGFLPNLVNNSAIGR